MNILLNLIDLYIIKIIYKFLIKYVEKHDFFRYKHIHNRLY